MRLLCGKPTAVLLEWVLSASAISSAWKTRRYRLPTDFHSSNLLLYKIVWDWICRTLITLFPSDVVTQVECSRPRKPWICHHRSGAGSALLLAFQTLLLQTLNLQSPLLQQPKELFWGLKSCKTAKTPLNSFLRGPLLCGEVPTPPSGLLPAWQFRKQAEQWAFLAHYSPLKGNQRECLSSYYSIVQFYGGLSLNTDFVKEAQNLM